MFSALNLPADELTIAREQEKEGYPADARDSYIRWLDSRTNRGDPSYGRILLHTLRISGTIEEDLDLIDRFYPYLEQSEDKLDIYETAVILTELISDRARNRKYLDLLTSLQPEISGAGRPAMDRLLKQEELRKEESITSRFMSIQPAGGGNILYLLVLSQMNDSAELDLWVRKAEEDNPSLLLEPDWLYLVQRQFNSTGSEQKAAAYRDLLIKKFPRSIEAALLRKGKIHTYPYPDDFLRNPSIFENLTETSEIEAEVVYIQAGAFQNSENAVHFKENLETHGLHCLVLEEDSVFKVVIVTDDFDETIHFLDSLGIRGFRIPRIP